MTDDQEATVSWRQLLAEATSRFITTLVPEPETSARRIVEEAAGLAPSDLVLGLDQAATVRGVAQFDAMVARRLQGEPLQYVVGHWGFRRLDLLVDRRVLIPRPETEQVAGWAIDELAADGDERSDPGLVVDLGTGSGAIGLSFLAERDDVEVWLTDESSDALAVARANLAGLGRSGARGRVSGGSWFDALPDELAGRFSVVVSNPPYVAATEVLPAEVEQWEPTSALVAGPSGREALDHLVDTTPGWLRPEGALVLETAPDQAETVAARANEAFTDVEIKVDLADRPRAVVARGPRSPSS